MYKILVKLLGQVSMNKILCMTQDIISPEGKEKLSFVKKVLIVSKLFYGSWLNIVRYSEPPMQFYMVSAPFLNLFLLSGFFPFVMTMISNYVFFRIVMNKE